MTAFCGVPDDAHARFSATERGYVYKVHRWKDPFLHDRSHLLRPPLDVDAMNTACVCLIGKQDFSSFQRTGSDNRTSICDVRHARWEATEAGYQFTIRADRFLRNMVRAITGLSFRIGREVKGPASKRRSGPSWRATGRWRGGARRPAGSTWRRCRTPSSRNRHER